MLATVTEADLGTGPLVVLAPHADDELIGCAGWLILSQRRNVGRSVVVTGELDPVREREMRRAQAGLNLQAVARLDLPDSGACSNEEMSRAVSTLCGQISRARPSLLFVPSENDPHPLHRVTVELAKKALVCLQPLQSSLRLVQYEGLVPFSGGNWWLDISSVAMEKFSRLAAYETQDKRYRLVESIGHLNAYRGCTTMRRRIRHAEVFNRQSVEEYLR